MKMDKKNDKTEEHSPYMFQKITQNGITKQYVPRWSDTNNNYQLILTDVELKTKKY